MSFWANQTFWAAIMLAVVGFGLSHCEIKQDPYGPNGPGAIHITINPAGNPPRDR
jgi:hypothetical protein